MNRKPKSKQASTLPLAGEGKRGEQGHLGYLLRQAGAAWRGSVERALADLDVTAPQFVVLTLVGAYPGVSNAEVARLSHLTPQTVNVIMANLKRAGALASQPHATHGRIQQLALTAGGSRLLALARPRVQVLEEQLVAGLRAAEQRIVRRWLVRVALEADQAAIARSGGVGA